LNLFSRKRDSHKDERNIDSRNPDQPYPKYQIVTVNTIPDRNYKVLSDDGVRLDLEDLNSKERIIVLKEDTEQV